MIKQKLPVINEEQMLRKPPFIGSGLEPELPGKAGTPDEVSYNHEINRNTSSFALTQLNESEPEGITDASNIIIAYKDGL